MARLNGVEVKKVSTMAGHDGEAVHSAVIYIDGKKAGSWSEDSWGGPDSYTSGLFERIKPRSEAFMEGSAPDDKYWAIYSEPNVFMGMLMRLATIEGVAKKLARKGCKTIAIWPKGRMLCSCGFELAVGEQTLKKALGNEKGFEKHITLYGPNVDLTVDARHPIPLILLH